MKNIFTLIIALLMCTSIEAQTENFWVKKADFGGLKRSRAIGFSVGNFGYVGTGIDTLENVHNDLWKYDPSLNVWSQVASIPGSARRNAIAFTIGSKGYVGTGMSAAESSMGFALADFWEYDPSTNAWTVIAASPTGGVYYGTGFSVDGKGYMCGGKHGPNWYSNQLWEYDPIADNWTPKSSFPGGLRYQLSSFVVNNSAYVGLGTDQDMHRSDIWEYKPLVDQWTQKSDLPASERGASHAFSIGNRGFICMGGNGGLLDDLWEYNPLDDSWSVKADFDGSKRKGGIAFSINEFAYVGTGKGSSGKKSSFWQYVPSAYVSVDEQSLADIIIYPNPAQDILNVQTSGDQINLIEIQSLDGKTVLATEMAAAISTLDIPSGIYFLVGKNENGQIIGKEKLIIL
ncbi:MAG: T9SS type A sorting domain-containing protein [Crocinitomicaceae bacterium]|nr:T9SS type A sorting domain-containing protein [Crocinitomicaceae bacterium]